MADNKGPNHPELGGDPLVGAQFGPYRIIGRIADGERGEIYFAEAPDIHRKVAVKVFREEYCRDQEALKEFHAEIKLVKEIAHDGVAEVFDVGWTTDKRIYVIMERLQGETLQDRIDRGPLPFAEAMPIIGQTLVALSALHQRGVIHRDLRPDRIFLCQRQDGPPKVKLLGFGVSRLVNLDDLRKRLPKLSATSEAAVAAHYLSPEQIVNKPVDARTDLFALGIILYETFAGQLPFAGVGVVQVLAKQAQGQIPALPELDPKLQVPPELRDVIAKATKREPAERFPDTAKLLDILTDLASSRGISILPTSKPRAQSLPVPALQLPTPSQQQLPTVSPLKSPAPGQPSLPSYPNYAQGGYPPPAPNQSGQTFTQNPAYQFPTPPPGQMPVPAGGYATPAPGQPPVNYPSTNPNMPAMQSSPQGYPPASQNVPSQPYPPAGQSAPPQGYPPPNLSGGYAGPQNYPPQYQGQYPPAPQAGQSAPPQGYPPPNLSGGYPGPQNYPPQNVPAGQSAPPQGYPPPNLSGGYAGPQNYQNPPPGQPVYPTSGQPNYDPRYSSGNFYAYNQPSGNFSPTTAQPPPPQAPPAPSEPAPVSIPTLSLGGSFGGSKAKTKAEAEAPEPAPASGAMQQWGGAPERRGSSVWLIVGGVVVAIALVVWLLSGKSGKNDADEGAKKKNNPTETKSSFSLAQVDERCLPLIRKGFESQDAKVRARAVEIAGVIQDQDRVEALRVRVTDKDPDVRAKAAWALGQLGDKSVIPGLRELQKTADPSTQLHIDEALYRLGDTDALKRMQNALDSKEFETQRTAAQILASLGDESAIPFIKKLLKAKVTTQLAIDLRGSLARLGDSEAKEALLLYLKSDDSYARIMAAEALARAGFGDGQDTLQYIFDDEKSPFRLPAAKALARPGNTSVEKLLALAATQIKDPAALIIVVEGLGKGAKEEDSLRTLWDLLDSTTDEAQLAVAGALLQAKSRRPEFLEKRTVSWAKDALNNTVAETRELACQALANAKKETAAPLLEKALEDSDPGVVAAAAHSLGRVGKIDALTDVKGSDPRVLIAVGDAFLRLGDASGVGYLQQAYNASKDDRTKLAAIKTSALDKDRKLAKDALKEKSLTLRFGAALALASAGDDTGEAVLNEVLSSKEKDFENKLLASFGLWQLGRTDGAGGNPVGLLRQVSTRNRPEMIQALYRLPTKDALPILRLAITDPDDKVRRAAILALGQYKDEPEKLSVLFYDALSDPKADIRAAAAFALLRLNP